MFGLECAEFSNMKDKNGLLYFDKEQKSIAKELVDQESLLYRVISKWKESISPIVSSFHKMDRSWNDLVHVYGEMSVKEFLQENNWSDELIEGFAKVGIGLGSYGAIMHLSAIEILRLFIGDGDGYEAKNLQLKGGMERLTQAFLNDEEIPLHELVEYECKVTSVERQADFRYLIRSEKTTGNEDEGTVSHLCDFVILTAPIPALKAISFDPPLTDNLQDAIKDVHYVKAVKIFLQTKTPFWLKKGVDGVIISDLRSECDSCMKYFDLLWYFLFSHLNFRLYSPKHLLCTRKLDKREGINHCLLHLGGASKSLLSSDGRREDQPCN